MQDGSTALMWAAENGHVKVVQCLVEAGVSLDESDNVSGHVVWAYVDV